MTEPSNTIQIGAASSAYLLDVHRQMRAVFTPASNECWSLERLTDFLPRPETLLRIARFREADDLSGFELARRFADATEASTLSVDAAHRRQGIARRLVQNIIMMIQKGGEKPIFLEVRGGNKPAQNLYLGQGFEAVGGRRAYYVNEDEGRSDALTMRLKIS